MYVADGLQLGAVHGVLVRAVLEVQVRRDLLHHVVVVHEVVVLAVLLAFLRFTRRVCNVRLSSRITLLIARVESKSTALFYSCDTKVYFAYYSRGIGYANRSGWVVISVFLMCRLPTP